MVCCTEVRVSVRDVFIELDDLRDESCDISTNLNFKLLIMERTLSFEPLPDLEVVIKAKIDKFLQQ